MSAIEISILPKTLRVERISRGGQLLERYFIHCLFRNLTGESVKAERVEIVFRNPLRGTRIIYAFEGDALREYFNSSQRFIDDREGSLEIGPDERRGVIEHRAEADGPMAATEVECRFYGHKEDGHPVENAESRLIARADARSALTLPVRGIWWVVGGHSHFEPHSRSHLPALVYAYDFIRLGRDGKSFRAEGAKNKDYYAHGQPVFAAAEGEVALAVDGIEENEPSKTPRRNPDSYNDANSIPMPGNHVVIKHAEGEYGFYAHLQPGLAVESGQRVERGQMIGLVGNSGESTEPHLHFHLADGTSLDEADGIPAIFANWREDAFSITPGLIEEGVVLSREIIQSAQD
jgi:hypothetical protein